MVMLHRTRVYKILSAPDWALAKELGVSRTALDEGDGYVHLSTRGADERPEQPHLARALGHVFGMPLHPDEVAP